jgi:hypothetical protein
VSATDTERARAGRDLIRDGHLLAAQQQVVSKLEVETELFLREKS